MTIRLRFPSLPLAIVILTIAASAAQTIAGASPEGAGLNPASAQTTIIRKLGVPPGRILSVSPDGRYVSFMPRENYNVDVYETNTGKTWTAVKGTAEKSAWAGAVFSADSSQIAYTVNESIYAAKLDGTGAKEIYKGEKDSYVWLVDWLLDSRKLIAVLSTDTEQIGTVAIDGGEFTEIKRLEKGANVDSARLSSNGRYLAIRVKGDGKHRTNISVIELESKIQSYLAGQSHGIHRYEIGSGTTETFVKQHKDGKGWNCHPRLSPDGKSLYYTRRIFTEEGNEWKDHIVRHDLPSGQEEIVAELPEKINIWWPFELSPDGTRLALVMSDQFKNDDFTLALRILPVEGGAAKELFRTAPRENINSLSWTPDGKRLVFTKQFQSKEKRTDDRSELWSLDIESGKTVQIRLHLPRMREVSVHPDGRQVVLQAGSSDGNGQDVWVMQGLIREPNPGNN